MIIYFPRTFGSSYNMINVVKQYFKERHIETTIIVSHPDQNSLTLHAGDVKLIEPTYNADENDMFYEKVVIDYKVDLIIPGESSLLFFKTNENKFKALGTKLMISASAELLSILRSKTSTYQYFKEQKIDIAIPLYKNVTSLDAFIDICNEIESIGSIPCFKPDVSQGASGFRIVDNTVNTGNLIYGFPSHKASIDYYISLFKNCATFPNLIVTEYLSGEEVTLDTLSFNQSCLCYFPRIKDLNNRCVIDRPLFKPLISDFISKSEINFLWNIQLRYHNNKPYLLEVNPRYSGGSYLAEENGYKMLCGAIEIIMFDKIPSFPPLKSMNFKMVESYIQF